MPPESLRLCSIADCGQPARTRGWCAKHYKRWWKTGDPLTIAPRRRRSRPIEESIVEGRMTLRTLKRWTSKLVFQADGCVTWDGCLNDSGYGMLGVHGKAQRAHRLAYAFFVGPLPDGDLDHLCRNRACVRPDHLEAVSRGENTKRGLNGDLKTRCAQGHHWAENRVRRPNGAYTCGECRRERSACRRVRAA